MLHTITGSDRQATRSFLCSFQNLICPDEIFCASMNQINESKNFDSLDKNKWVYMEIIILFCFSLYYPSPSLWLSAPLPLPHYWFQEYFSCVAYLFHTLLWVISGKSATHNHPTLSHLPGKVSSCWKNGKILILKVNMFIHANECQALG